MPSILQLLLGGSQFIPVDPFFYSVTSLLHGDGTNGAQNNTFLDSSTNNFTITRNGNTTQGSFSPFSQTGWGNYFDGNGDYLATPSSTAFDCGTSSFTLEFWFYDDGSSTSYPSIFSSTDWTPGVGGVSIRYNNTGAANKFYVAKYANNGTPNGGSGINELMLTANTYPSRTWHHVAFVRNGNNFRIYVNGIKDAETTSTVSIDWNLNSAGAKIGGGNWDGANSYIKGYISNLRLVKGTAVYTDNFTVPTTPLTAITNTSLLTCQANRFLDASSNAFAITRNGDVSVQPFSPFNPTTAYSTSAVGGSGYFDGSGDYLNFAGATANAMGSGDFTIEGWFYLTGTTGQGGSGEQGIIGVNTVAASRLTIRLQGTSPKVMSWWLNGPGNNVAGTTAIQQNTWYHFALVRSGSASNNVKLYLNGVLESQGTSTYDVPTGDYVVGRTYTDLNGEYWNGFLSGIRAVKGTAVYTGNFTPPTAPPTAISNTSYLFNFTNAGIFDNAAVADYETVGNAQISTSVKKYGTGSIALDGTGDYLVPQNTPQMSFGTGNFTVEGWIYPTNVADNKAVVSNRSDAGADSVFAVALGTTNGLYFHTQNTVILNTGFVPPVNTWTHFAFCRTAGVLKGFVNGTQVGASTAFTSNLSSTLPLMVGHDGTKTTTPASDFVGYIDDLRISKGVGRYPYNFTPPTAEFPNIGGTVTLTADPYFDYTTLLLPGNGTNGAQNNTFLDSSTNNFTITRNGNTTQGTFSPFSQTGWGNYFDGSGDYLSVADNAALDLGTGDFTIECWVYPITGISNVDGLIGKRNQGTFNSGDWRIAYISASTSFGIACGQDNVDRTTPSINLNAWNHVAFVRSSGTLSCYANGLRNANLAWAHNLDNAEALLIGLNVATYDLPGYISNVRIVKGTAVYSGATYTVPTAPLTAITNTSLLTCQSNRFVDNSSNAFAITRNGDVSVQAFSPFNPTAAWSAATYGGSGYFDGSGDYLSVADASAFTLGTSDFCVESWVYAPSVGTGASESIIGQWSSASYGWIFQYRSNKVLMYYSTTGANTLNAIDAAATVNPSAWNHIAFVRSGNTLSAYVNGTRVSNNTSFTASIANSSSAVNVGRNGDNSEYVTGYLSGTRMVVGSSVYDPTASTITVPTAPPTAVTNTQLLCNFTNAGIYDATSKNDLETVGNAQISTTQSKFGGSSMYFDGTGDYLSIPYSQAFNFGTGDFTVECWARISYVQYTAIITSTSTSISTGMWLLGFSNTANQMSFGIDGGGAAIVGADYSAYTNVWTHIAACRYGSTLRLFFNGNQVASVTNTTNFTGDTGSPVFMGRRYTNQALYDLNGYIQDLRISKGIARYTSNFTPPTTAFLTL